MYTLFLNNITNANAYDENMIAWHLVVYILSRNVGGFNNSPYLTVSENHTFILLLTSGDGVTYHTLLLMTKFPYGPDSKSLSSTAYPSKGGQTNRHKFLKSVTTVIFLLCFYSIIVSFSNGEKYSSSLDICEHFHSNLPADSTLITILVYLFTHCK